jgi:hypothetical protein
MISMQSDRRLTTWDRRRILQLALGGIELRALAGGMVSPFNSQKEEER